MIPRFLLKAEAATSNETAFRERRFSAPLNTEISSSIT